VVFGRTHQLGIAELMTGAAQLDGVKTSLVRAAYRAADPLPPADVVILSGIRGDTAEYLAAYRAQGTNCLVLEYPRLRLVPEQATQRVGLYPDTLQTLPLTVGNDAHAPPVFSRRKRTTIRRVLVCQQVARDTSHDLNDTQLQRVTLHMVRMARAHFGPNVRIALRTHPTAPQAFAEAVAEADSVDNGAASNITDALQQADAVVSYNSTVGWDAIALGVPTMYMAPEDLVSWSDYGSPLSQGLRVLDASERRLALLRAASCEWTFSQLEAGLPLAVHLGLASWPAPQLVEAGTQPFTTTGE